jgi:hypothetical protein
LFVCLFGGGKESVWETQQGLGQFGSQLNLAEVKKYVASFCHTSLAFVTGYCYFCSCEILAYHGDEYYIKVGDVRKWRRVAL